MWGPENGVQHDIKEEEIKSNEMKKLEWDKRLEEIFSDDFKGEVSIPEKPAVNLTYEKGKLSIDDRLRRIFQDDFVDLKDDLNNTKMEKKDVPDGRKLELGNSKLAQNIDNKENKNDTNYDSPIVKEEKEAIKNKLDGLAREKEVAQELEKKYPPEKGYQIISEAYLRDKDGNIVKDPMTGQARRIDFVVVKDGKVVDSIEVTSKTADKKEQCAKENRIRDVGGNYIRDNNGNLVHVPTTVRTRIERRD